MLLTGVLKQLFDYWESLPKAGESMLPARQHLMPTDLHEWMPRLTLLKRHERYQVHVSMIGTENNAGWRSPFIGMNSFDLTTPSMHENSAMLYEAVLDQPSAALMVEDILTKSGRRQCVQTLYLPLADKDGAPSYIVGCSTYRRKPSYNRINDRLMPNRDHVMNVEFIDIGAGLPSVAFEHINREADPSLSHHWWERFLPDLRRPKPDFRSHRNIDEEDAASGWSHDQKARGRRLDA